MTRRFDTLSGLWTGVFDYPAGMLEAVPFNADLVEALGLLTGSSEEPNTFSRSGGRELMASLDGERQGSRVTIRKRYHAADAAHLVLYEGEANAALTRIRGHWTVPGEPAFWSGPFVMDRVIPPGAEAERETSGVAGGRKA